MAVPLPKPHDPDADLSKPAILALGGLALAAIPATFVVTALIVQYAWIWFLAGPLGLPALSFWQSAGVAFVVASVGPMQVGPATKPGLLAVVSRSWGAVLGRFLCFVVLALFHAFAS